jgi:hypothetical protein
MSSEYDLPASNHNKTKILKNQTYSNLMFQRSEPTPFYMIIPVKQIP